MATHTTPLADHFEWERWVPSETSPGFHRFDRTATLDELKTAIKQVLKANQLDEYEWLSAPDEILQRDGGTAPPTPLPRLSGRILAIFYYTGSNEGYFVVVATVGRDLETRAITCEQHIVIKHFMDHEYSSRLVSRLTTFLEA